MWEYNYNPYYLPETVPIEHYGVLGMKWGRRRYQNKDGSLTPAGEKRYAEEGYAQDAYKSNKTKLGKAYDKITGAHKTAGKIKAESSTRAQNKKRANQYINSQTTKKTRKAVSNLSTGQAIGRSMLLGSYGGLVYTSLRANNVSKGKAAAQAVLNNWANNMTLGQLSKKAKW